MFFIAIVGFANAFRFGGASLDYYTVRNSVELWLNEGAPQTEENYLRAKQAVNTATLIHYSHPLYRQLVAQVKEWGVLAGFEPDLSLESAKASYLEAVELRPLWPVTWANLAMLKWRKQEFDDEMYEYLEKANQLGPQKAEVHLLFSQLGLTLYNANHPFYSRIREDVHERIKRGLRGNDTRRQLVNFIDATGNRKAVCRWINDPSEKFINDVAGCEYIK
jgi:tetratricopeptide (TPR) repeat protein